jgi:site-specific DNA recombinase
LTARRLSWVTPPEDWLVHDVPELRIVDDNPWERVRTRLGAIRNARVVKARATKFWIRRRRKHLLTGKARA